MIDQSTLDWLVYAVERTERGATPRVADVRRLIALVDELARVAHRLCPSSGCSGYWSAGRAPCGCYDYADGDGERDGCMLRRIIETVEGGAV